MRHLHIRQRSTSGVINPGIVKFRSLGELFTTLVPSYTNYGWSPLLVRWRWDRADADMMEEISANRCERRRKSYLLPGELDRATRSIRFGHNKTGSGYDGERKDFCLIGGALKDGNLSLFYRRLEMIGGLHYDLAVMAAVEDAMGPLKTITLFAVKADTFTRKGNSNEKLYKQLRIRYAS